MTFSRSVKTLIIVSYNSNSPISCVKCFLAVIIFTYKWFNFCVNSYVNFKTVRGQEWFLTSFLRTLKLEFSSVGFFMSSKVSNSWVASIAVFIVAFVSSFLKHERLVHNCKIDSIYSSYQLSVNSLKSLNLIEPYNNTTPSISTIMIMNWIWWKWLNVMKLSLNNLFSSHVHSKIFGVHCNQYFKI